jgi:serine protease SohB
METFIKLTLEMIFSLIQFGAILFLIVISIRAIMSGINSEERSKLNIIHLNERFKKRQLWLRHMMMSPETRDVAERLEAREEKSAKKQKTRQAKKELKSKQSKQSKQGKQSKQPQASSPHQDHDKSEDTQSITGDEQIVTPKVDTLDALSVDLVSPQDLQSSRTEVELSEDAINQGPLSKSVETETTDEAADETADEMANKKAQAQEVQDQEVQDQETQDQEAQDQEAQDQETSRLFVINFKGDIQASAVESLREEITAILQVQRASDEVLLCLHNAGGYVHTHGLAASQLTRLTSAGIRLTVAIDQVAASGGYMMACVGERIIAAPFAIVGSIGVVAQIPNVNRLLKRYDVDVELHTAGDYKRTLTVLGENTDEGRAKFVEELHKTHNLFQNFVHDQRPKLDVSAVATGETWYGSSAVDVGLVDEIMTSDELILNSLQTHDVYLIEYQRKTKASERVLSWAHALFNGRLPEI